MRKLSQIAGSSLLLIATLYMVVGTAHWLTIQPIVALHSDRELRHHILNIRPSSDRPNEGAVLLRGRIEPNLSTRSDAGGLALVERETLRTDHSWQADLIAHPQFELLLLEGSVRVTNGCSRVGDFSVGRLLNITSTEVSGVDQRCYRIGGETVRLHDHEGSPRYRGFRPGDQVLVAGTVHNGELTAKAVFAGSPEAYAATLRYSSWQVFLTVALGVLFSALGTFVLWKVIVSPSTW